MNDKLKKLIGKKLKRYFINKNKDELLMEFEDGTIYIFYHFQDCCEDVHIDDISKSLDDIIGEEILNFEEKTSIGEVGFGSFTWTFYDIDTFNNHIQIKWYGESNGYYSEKIDLLIVGKEKLWQISKETKQQVKEMRNNELSNNKRTTSINA